MMKRLNPRRMVLILLVACGIGVALDGTRWLRARTDMLQLMETRRASDTARARTRESRPKLTTADYASLCQFMDTKNVAASEAARSKVTVILTHIGELDAEQIRALANDLPKTGDYGTKQHQREILQFAIESLASRDPQAAIDLLKNPSGELVAMNLFNTTLPAVLMTWHEQDPDAAGGWIRQQIQSGGGIVDWDTLSKLPGSLAPRDPVLAFALMGELHQRGMEVAAGSVTRNATNDKARSAALGALRKLQEKPGNSNSKIADDAWQGFADNLMTAGPGVSGKWLESADLTESERLDLSDHIMSMEEPRDRAFWLTWTADSVPGEEMPSRIGVMVNAWAKTNHRDAGTFIRNMPDGEARNAAIQAFAVTVARIDADAAEQWAQTLPQGPVRDQTLLRIRANANP